MTRVAIIGGGLAGTACAYVFKKAGLNPVIYEAGSTLASGASGNDVGLYNPRFGAEWSLESQFYAGAFDLALETFQDLKDIDWNACGALHLITDEKKRVRFEKMAKSWPWPKERIQILNAQEASAMAGIEITHDALYLPQSGYVSPHKLCAAYARDIEVHLNHEIKDLGALDADVVVLASGTGALAHTNLPLQTVRGQITIVTATEKSAALKACLCYGGYASPAIEGAHIVGSSFQRWLDHTNIIEADDHNNIRKLGEAVPSLADHYKVIDHRAALRVASKDHFPVIGRLPDHESIYVSIAHGSHGVLSSLAGAQVLLSLITRRPVLFNEGVVGLLHPGRFSPLRHPAA